MITASEALLMSKTEDQIIKDHLDFLESEIKKQALKGFTGVHITQDPYCSWLYDKENMTDIQKKVIEELVKNGFEVSFHYKEMSMGVDYALAISWKNGGAK